MIAGEFDGVGIDMGAEDSDSETCALSEKNADSEDTFDPDSFRNGKISEACIFIPYCEYRTRFNVLKLNWRRRN